MSLLNRLATSKNSYQGSAPRVLCVCSAGLLRSPTAAFLLSQPPYNFNTRACGDTPTFALICLDEVLCEWADAFVVMNDEQAASVTAFGEHVRNKAIHVLNVPDTFPRMDSRLQRGMSDQFEKLWPEGKFFGQVV